MVPRTTTGRSFKGAAAYYLHDKGADTSERVGWTHTLNLFTNDPDKAWRMMACTAMMSEDLKKASGIPLTGRKGEYPVYAFSLSWHPDETPDQAHMIETAQSALKALKLDDRQALIVCHTDEEQPHIHIMVNRVDPRTGKMAGIGRDQYILSRWAEKYERDISRKIWCGQRVENNRRRDAGETVKYRENRIESAWKRADTARAFQAGLKEYGYTLARGKRGAVVVDPQGSIHTIARTVGIKAAEVKQRLSALDLKSLPDANKIAQQRLSEREERRATFNRQAGKNTGPTRQQQTQIRHSHAENITRAWQSSDTGAGFQAALKGQGYVLASGSRHSTNARRVEKPRYVVVAPDGSIHKPERRIESVRKKDMDARCQAIALKDLPDANALSEQRRTETQIERSDHRETFNREAARPAEAEHRDAAEQIRQADAREVPETVEKTSEIWSRDDDETGYQHDLHDAAQDQTARREETRKDAASQTLRDDFDEARKDPPAPVYDRDQYEADWQKEIVDAAIAAADEERQAQEKTRKHEEWINAQRAALQSRHLDERITFDRDLSATLSPRYREVNEAYDPGIVKAEKTIAEIQARQALKGFQGWFQRLVHRDDANDVKNLQKTLDNARQRKAEAMARLEREKTAEKQKIEQKQENERLDLEKRLTYRPAHDPDLSRAGDRDTSLQRPGRPATGDISDSAPAPEKPTTGLESKSPDIPPETVLQQRYHDDIVALDRRYADRRIRLEKDMARQYGHQREQWKDELRELQRQYRQLTTATGIRKPGRSRVRKTEPLKQAIDATHRSLVSNEQREAEQWQQFERDYDKEKTSIEQRYQEELHRLEPARSHDLEQDPVRERERERFSGRTRSPF